MRTVVLDDDPTGTQSASGVQVLLECSADLLVAALARAESVYVQTNSRAIDEAAAVALLRRIKTDALAAGDRLGEPIQFVLRGDSTLRGHVFAESEVFLDRDSILLFVPAFPDGGRTTVDNVHYVRVGGQNLPAHRSEFAADPVFGFSSGVLAEFVAEKSVRHPVPVALADVRGPGLAAALRTAPPGSVVLPDALTNDDIELIAEAARTASLGGRRIVVRCAAPLAAALAGVESDGLMPAPLVATARRTLLVCGSHTAAATAQLAEVARLWGEPLVIDTAVALRDPDEAATTTIEAVRKRITGPRLAVITSERVRSSDHNTLAHGERVMDALTRVVRAVVQSVEVVVAKGGITSAEVARIGIGARSAVVLGQVLPGISVWRLTAFDGRELLYIVVPGNVGEADTLVRVLEALAFGANAVPG